MPMRQVKDLNTLGKRLRWLRLKEGWSQEELAQRVANAAQIEVAREHISNIEWDKREPSLALLRAFADALNADAGWLVTGRKVAPAQLAASDPLAAVLVRLSDDRRAWLLELAHLMLEIDDDTARQVAELHQAALLVERQGGPELRRAAARSFGGRTTTEATQVQ